MSRSMRGEKGGAVLEFAIVSVVIIPLFLGTVALGLQMGHSIESLQICRDVGHMYAKGIDFSQTGNQNIAVNLASASGMTLTGGNGTLILSQVITIYQADCDAGNHSNDCTNLGTQVFVNRIQIGNSGLRSSNYGTPASSIINSSGNLAANDYLTNTTARATGFSAVLLSGNMTQAQGQVAYLVEFYRTTPDLSFLGVTGSNGVYAKFIF